MSFFPPLHLPSSNCISPASAPGISRKCQLFPVNSCGASAWSGLVLLPKILQQLYMANRVAGVGGNPATQRERKIMTLIFVPQTYITSDSFQRKFFTLLICFDRHSFKLAPYGPDSFSDTNHPLCVRKEHGVWETRVGFSPYPFEGVIVAGFFFPLP